MFYIRTSDASSRPAFRAVEMHALIQRALRNQREALGRMLRGILYESRLATCEQTHTLVDTANNNALSLRDGATANTNAILAKLDAMQNQALQDKIAALTAEKATLQSEISQRNQNATILNAVGQQIAPLAAGLQALQSDVDGIKCKLPNTVSVPYPQLQVYNPEVARAAAVGAAAGQYAGYGCGYTPTFWN